MYVHDKMIIHGEVSFHTNCGSFGQDEASDTGTGWRSGAFAVRRKKLEQARISRKRNIDLARLE
jgi:hypothetical protein